MRWKTEPWESPSFKGRAEEKKYSNRNKRWRCQKLEKDLEGEILPKPKRKSFREKPVNSFLSHLS